MPTWLLVIILASLRACYASLFESLLSLGILKLLNQDTSTILFGALLISTFIPSFIISWCKVNRLMK